MGIKVGVNTEHLKVPIQFRGFTPGAPPIDGLAVARIPNLPTWLLLKTGKEKYSKARAQEPTKATAGAKRKKQGLKNPKPTRKPKGKKKEGGQRQKSRFKNHSGPPSSSTQEH